jgi:hypothetical protein
MAIVRTYKIGNTTIVDHDDDLLTPEKAAEALRRVGRIAAQDEARKAMQRRNAGELASAPAPLA